MKRVREPVVCERICLSDYGPAIVLEVGRPFVMGVDIVLAYACVVRLDRPILRKRHMPLWIVEYPVMLYD